MFKCGGAIGVYKGFEIGRKGFELIRNKRIVIERMLKQLTDRARQGLSEVGHLRLV